MKDILRPMLELFVALPGLLLAYFLSLIHISEPT